jgi:hypothetical protein
MTIFASGLSLLLTHKLAEYSIPAERLGEILRTATASDHCMGSLRRFSPMPAISISLAWKGQPGRHPRSAGMDR